MGGQDGKRQKSGMSLDFLRKESLFSLSDEDLGDQIFNAASRFNVEARAAVHANTFLISIFRGLHFAYLRAKKTSRDFQAVKTKQ